MKNTSFILLIIVALASGCNKESFIKKLVGTYKVESYIKANKNETNAFKAEKQDYVLDIQSENVYTESFLLNGLVYKKVIGEWQLINSNKDLQMIDAENQVRMFNIVKMESKCMTLTKGNEEYQFTEK